MANTKHLTSKLESIIQSAWAEPNLAVAKKLVKDHIASSNIKSRDSILATLDTITSKAKFDFYIANSLLAFEKLSVGKSSSKYE
jgi:hypothetical protein